MRKLKGEDVCAGCDETYCNQQAACGYVQVKFGHNFWISKYISGHIKICYHIKKKYINIQTGMKVDT